MIPESQMIWKNILKKVITMTIKFNPDLGENEDIKNSEIPGIIYQWITDPGQWKHCWICGTTEYELEDSDNPIHETDMMGNL